MIIVEVQHVSYRYKGTESFILKNINCTFETGKLYAIIGPSGSGKSTFLSLLAGLDSPAEGEIMFQGVSLAEMDMDQYRRESVSMIFQAFHLFPLLTVIENVCYPMELLGIKKSLAKEHASQFLKRVGISSDKYKRFPSHLSGGEQQRVAIARSLASGAPVILADEPTGNLDGTNTEKIMDVLTCLVRENGHCIIVVTHDMEVARKADVVLQMKDGVLTEAR